MKLNFATNFLMNLSIFLLSLLVYFLALFSLCYVIKTWSNLAMMLVAIWGTLLSVFPLMLINYDKIKIKFFKISEYDLYGYKAKIKNNKMHKLFQKINALNPYQGLAVATVFTILLYVFIYYFFRFIPPYVAIVIPGFYLAGKLKTKQ